MWRIACLVSAVLLLSPGAGADILIGTAGPFSGQYAQLGNTMKTGVEMAIAAINDEGGINGERLTLIAIDDACDTKRASEAARQFRAQDVRLVVGHYCSGSTAAAALIYSEAGILMMTPSASQPALTAARHWNLFRLAGRDDAPFTLAAARILASDLQENAAIVASEGLSSLAAEAKRLLPKAWHTQVRAAAFDPAAIAKGVMERKSRHLIVVLAAQEAARLARALQSQGFTGTIYGNEQLLVEAFVSQLADPGFEILAAFPDDPLSYAAAAALVEKFRAAGIEPEGATLPAYAAVQIFAQAARNRSVNDARAMADWIRNTKSMHTVVGTISFDAFGELARQPFTWYRWSGQAKRFVAE